MKKRYKNQEGGIVELDDEEFLYYPKNARLTLVGESLKEETKTPEKGKVKEHGNMVSKR